MCTLCEHIVDVGGGAGGGGGGTVLSLVSSSLPPCCSEWVWHLRPLSVWPLKSEKTKRDCPGLKGSSSQFTQNEHTLTQTHVKRVSNKHLYQEFENKEASAPCVAAHTRLNTRTHKHISRRNVLERPSQTQQRAHPLTHIPQSHNSNLS